MRQKTRKHCKKNKRNCLTIQYTDATKGTKKGTIIKCSLKTCRAKKYQSIYGGASGGAIRSRVPLFF